MKTGYKTNQRIRISRRRVCKAWLPTERAGEVGSEDGGERTCLKLRLALCRVSGELELVDDARRPPEGPEARAGTGQSPAEHAGDATPRGCGRCKCQSGDSTGAASRDQIGYVKIALQMRSLLGRRLASQVRVCGFLTPPLSMDAHGNSPQGKGPGARSCPPAVPLPSQRLPRVPAHCLLPIPWLFQLLHVQALRFLPFY